MLITGEISQVPMAKQRANSARWYKGKASAAGCAQPGKLETGKKVPLNRNIGVMKRNMGRLNMSMVGVIPVKNIPIAPNANPPKNAMGINNNPMGN